MKNEALRLFLAITALILTALLTNPLANVTEVSEADTINATHETRGISKKVNRKLATEKNSEKRKGKSTRSFAFFFRR